MGKDEPNANLQRTPTLGRMRAIAVLEVSRLSRDYKTRKEVVHALRDVDLVMDEGKIVGLLGLNGAGKTTMLKVISTLLLPTAGTVRVDGFDVVERREERIADTCTPHEVTARESLHEPAPKCLARSCARHPPDRTLTFATHRSRPLSNLLPTQSNVGRRS